jgi:hypothetical protein
MELMVGTLKMDICRYHAKQISKDLERRYIAPETVRVVEKPKAEIHAG